MPCNIYISLNPLRQYSFVIRLIILRVWDIMSFDILREWDLESFDPGLEFFPETERATSLEVVEPPAVAAAPVTANIEVPKADEMAREAASSAAVAAG